MTSERPEFLGDYVEVKDRIRILYELYANARLVTSEVQIVSAGGKDRVMVRALAYRTPDDPHPGVGYSWLELPGTTPYTRGSELENAETSAWGRAIASLGILVDRSIASAQEVESKIEMLDVGDKVRAGDEPKTDGPWIELRDCVVSGEVSFGGSPVDGSVRQTPDGPIIGFRLKPDKGRVIPQVMAYGGLAEALDFAKLRLGDRITVTGDLWRVPWDKDGKAKPAYQRLVAVKFVTPEWTLPA